MDENEVRETEGEETEELESGDSAEDTQAEEQEQEIEEHDWGAIENRIDELEQRVNGIAEAMATMSVVNESDADDNPAEDVDEEYGEAVDLGGLEQMLGL